MKLDIVLITYNQEQYIAQAVESILMQRVYDDVQVRVIVADDCSTDKTLDIIKSYEEKSQFEFVYFPKEENMGISANYKRSFEATEAEYVTVLEGDDWWCSPCRLQTMIDFLENHHECVMAVNKRINYIQDKKAFESVNTIQNDNTYRYYSFNDLTLCNYIGNFSSCMYRQNTIQSINPKMWNVDVGNVDDWLTALELSQHGLVAVLDSVMTAYRVNSAGEWSKLDEEKKHKDILHRIDVYNEYFEYKYDKQFKAHKKRYLHDIEQYNIETNWSPCKKFLYDTWQAIIHIPTKCLYFMMSPSQKQNYKNRYINRK